jgi:hypothetical protein
MILPMLPIRLPANSEYAPIFCPDIDERLARAQRNLGSSHCVIVVTATIDARDQIDDVMTDRPLDQPSIEPKPYDPIRLEPTPSVAVSHRNRRIGRRRLSG